MECIRIDLQIQQCTVVSQSVSQRYFLWWWKIQLLMIINYAKAKHFSSCFTFMQGKLLVAAELAFPNKSLNHCIQTFLTDMGSTSTDSRIEPVWVFNLKFQFWGDYILECSSFRWTSTSIFKFVHVKLHGLICRV